MIFVLNLLSIHTLFDPQVLRTECSVLRESLSEFTRWVRQKIQLVEEDMDIFKVVYSLHGSLSQVAKDIIWNNCREMSIMEEHNEV